MTENQENNQVQISDDLKNILAILKPNDAQEILRLKEELAEIQSEKVELEKQRAAGYKGNFEQESLGRPARKWPFYKTRLENGLLQFCPAN